MYKLSDKLAEGAFEIIRLMFFSNSDEKAAILEQRNGARA